MYLKIGNVNEINPKALSLVGASTKDGESQIGQFGSGNKYALAYLLRNGHTVKVFSGTTEISIETKEEEFNGETFEVIWIDGKETSITTRMGKDWKLWQAIREFYSNAIDEGEPEISTTNKVKGVPGETNFFISLTDELLDIVTKDFEVYFANEDRVIYESEHGKILESFGKTAVYRRGIKAFETDSKSIYNYDLPDLRINESRVAEYSWDVYRNIWKIILTCTDKAIIKQVLLNSSTDMLEDMWEKPYGIKPSEEFIEVCQEINVQPAGLMIMLEVNEVSKYTFVKEELFNMVSSKLTREEAIPDLRFDLNSGSRYAVVTATPLETDTIFQAEKFLNECKLPNEYEIVVAKFSNDRVLGMADKENNRVVLSRKGLERGIHDVVNTIIEENIHLKTGAKDNTREFQYEAINLLINYAKEHNSYNI